MGGAGGGGETSMTHRRTGTTGGVVVVVVDGGTVVVVVGGAVVEVVLDVVLDVGGGGGAVEGGPGGATGVGVTAGATVVVVMDEGGGVCAPAPGVPKALTAVTSTTAASPDRRARARKLGRRVIPPKCRPTAGRALTRVYERSTPRARKGNLARPPSALQVGAGHFCHPFTPPTPAWPR
jgi:hypothetical protein